MDLKTRYKIKGLGKEQTIESVIKIHTDNAGKKIVMVEDKWDGNLPEGPFAKVSFVYGWYFRGIADLWGARLSGISTRLLFRRLWECRRMRRRMLRGETRGVFQRL